MKWKKSRAPKSNTSLLKLAVYEGITMDIEACRNRKCMNFVINPNKVCVKCLKGDIDLINEEEVILKSRRLRENYYHNNNAKVKDRKSSISIDKEVTLFLSKVIIDEGFRLWGVVPHPIIEQVGDGYKSRKIKTMLQQMKEIFQEWYVMKYGTNSPYLFNKEMLEELENYHDTHWDRFIYFDNEELIKDGHKKFPLFKEIK
jgi:hypothetical protein